MHIPANGNTNAHNTKWHNDALHDYRWHDYRWHREANPNEDPNVVWLRHDIEEIFNNHPAGTLTGLHRIAQIAALTGVLTFLILTIALALTAPM